MLARDNQAWVTLRDDNHAFADALPAWDQLFSGG
jgi:hypothetical protein